MTQFIHCWKLYEKLTELGHMKWVSHIDPNGFEPVRLCITRGPQSRSFWVAALSKSTARMMNKSHRIHVLCDCGQWIPFGRMGQHYNTKACLVAWQKNSGLREWKQ